MHYHFYIDFCIFPELEIYLPNYCFRPAEVIWLKNHHCDADMSKAVWVKNCRMRMDFWAERLEADGALRLRCAAGMSWPWLGWALFLGESLPVTYQAFDPIPFCWYIRRFRK